MVAGLASTREYLLDVLHLAIRLVDTRATVAGRPRRDATVMAGVLAGKRLLARQEADVHEIVSGVASPSRGVRAPAARRRCRFARELPETAGRPTSPGLDRIEIVEARPSELSAPRDLGIVCRTSPELLAIPGT